MLYNYVYILREPAEIVSDVLLPVYLSQAVYQRIRLLTQLLMAVIFRRA
jgi:hypothetical protein